MPARFHKGERLSSRKIISNIFQKPEGSIHLFPFRFSWLSVSLPSQYSSAILVTVPKRNFKKSVERNRLKRQMREAWRLKKETVNNYLHSKNSSAAFTLAYI